MEENKMMTIAIKGLFLVAMAFCFSPFVNGPIALIGGLAFSLVLGHPFIQWNRKAVGWLLKIGVIGLGFGMNIHETMKAGQDGLLLTASSIILILILGYFLGKYLNCLPNVTHLISSGTAICGGSAIAAIAPIIKASERDISVSLGVVFLLNSLALLIFPPIGQYFELTQHQFGLWSAIAIHDTSSVVGAAYTYGNEALNVATTVKLARALWIIPLSFLTIIMFKRKDKKINIPWFIFLFIGAILVNSYWPLPTQFTHSVTSLSKSILVLTLFLIGAGLSLDKIKATGWKPMVLGVSLWTVISISSLFVIISMQ